MPNPSDHPITTVIMYSTHSCAYCRQQKEWLDKHNITYTNYYVDDDPEKIQEMVTISGQRSLPFTRIIKDGEETHLVGFHADLLHGILKNNTWQH